MLEILYSSTNQKIRHLQEIELVPTILQSFSFTLYKGTFQKSKLAGRTTMVKPDILAMK